MAFNGFPQTYNNPYSPVQVAPAPMSGSNLTWVSGEAGAKSYLVSPNSTVPLFDSEGQTIYLKSADASGMPSIKILDYTIREVPTVTTPIASPVTDYASKGDIDVLRQEIEAIKARLGGADERSDSEDK